MVNTFWWYKNQTPILQSMGLTWVSIPLHMMSVWNLVLIQIFCRHLPQKYQYMPISWSKCKKEATMLKKTDSYSVESKSSSGYEATVPFGCWHKPCCCCHGGTIICASLVYRIWYVEQNYVDRRGLLNDREKALRWVQFRVCAGLSLRRGDPLALSKTLVWPSSEGSRTAPTWGKAREKKQQKSDTICKEQLWDLKRGW